jgi:hypothetical protein
MLSRLEGVAVKDCQSKPQAYDQRHGTVNAAIVTSR